MATRKRTASALPNDSLTAITIEGFKSFKNETRLGIRPLTLLAGANSSGKSSAMQPLLLLKQTLESPYDPGPLRLSGPNVRFTSMEQVVWRGPGPKDRAARFSIGLELRSGEKVRLRFDRRDHGVALDLISFANKDGECDLWEGMTDEDLRTGGLPHKIDKEAARLGKTQGHVKRQRFKLIATVQQRLRILGKIVPHQKTVDPLSFFEPTIAQLIHLPGLRGNPERSYATSEVGGEFPGVFQDYVASVIASWQGKSTSGLGTLGEAMLKLGLAARVDARRLDDTQVELRVSRVPSKPGSGTKDLVNIADVGLGVGQTLPVVVALLAAKPGQVVYVEQPEIHLHPRAQVALGGVLLDAARRGVIVIAETHSHLLIQAVQRAVASGEADPSLVQLHWFQLDKEGATVVKSAELDKHGTYGDWPEDFSDVELEADRSFLDASLEAS